MKLEPTEAQRKAMAEYLAGEYQAPSEMFDRCLKAVDALFAAANSIPEGPPVGTIARHPSGKWIAHRATPDRWEYTPFRGAAALEAGDDADSWPVIYDPTGFSELSIDLGPDWGEWGCNTLVEALSALGVKAGMNLGDIYEMVERGLEWFPPGEEPLVPRTDPTAQQEPCCGVSEVYDCDCPPAIRITPRPRTPRVVDRLGVDEQGTRWQDRQLGEWKFDGQAWRYLELTWTSVPGGEWVEAEPSKRYGPYVEVLS